MDSLRVICIAIGAVVVVCLVVGFFTYAFGAEPQEEYVMMSKETFEQIVKMLNLCQGHRI